MTGKSNRNFEKFELSFDPIVVVDANLYIIYKNKSAIDTLVRLRTKSNIKYLLDDTNIANLENCVKKKKSAFITVSIPQLINKCVAVYDVLPNNAEVAVLYFLESIKFMHNTLYSEEFTEFINTCRNETSKYGVSILKRTLELEKNGANDDEYKAYLRFVTSTQKKSLRLQKHLISVMSISDTEKKDSGYCNVTDSLNSVKIHIIDYTAALGYKVTFKVPDELFIMKISEIEFYSIVLTLISFILKSSGDGYATLSFDASNVVSGAFIRIECRPKDSILPILKAHVQSGWIKRLDNDDYLNLKYAMFMAEKNNLEILPAISDSDNVFSFKLSLSKSKQIPELNSKNLPYNYNLFLKNLVESEMSILEPWC